MAFDIEYIDSVTGLSTYALIFNISGQAYSTVTEIFASYNDSSIGNFDIPLTHSSSRAGLYTGSIVGVGLASFNQGKYLLEIYQQVGGSPSKSADILKAVGETLWNGSQEVSNSMTPKMENTFLGSQIESEDISWMVNVYNDFGKLQNAASGINYTVYEEGAATAITGFMSNISAGLYYGTFSSATGIFENNKMYEITLNGYLNGITLNTINTFVIKPSGSVTNPTIPDVRSELAYSSGFILTVQNASGFTTNLPSSVDDFYNGAIVRIAAVGSLYGQARIAFDYVGSTKQMITHKPFSTSPSSGQLILVFPLGGELNL